MLKRTLIFVLALSACTAEAADPESPTSSTTVTSLVESSTTTEVAPTSSTTTTTPPLLVDVRGRVMGPQRSVVEGATVTAADGTTVSGAYGDFSLQVPAGSALVVTKPGWTEASFEAGSRHQHVVIEPLRVRGIRVGADAAADPAVFGSLLRLASATAVNALVFDTKQEGGKVVYETEVADAHAIGAVDPVYDPVARLAEAHDAGLYTITRVVVFEDSFRASARPNEKLVGGWVDPRSESAWAYNVALAVEACEMGFDEIQFDYVRFPSGRTAQVSGQLGLTEAERVAAVESFLETARAELLARGCAMSADIFAIVVSVGDDQGLGQRPEELSRQVDALSPMIYPSHYSDGWLGFADPNDHPYAVTADAIDDALPRLADGTVLRPWLQAFWWSNDQIRESIQAAEDRNVGWVLWNVRSNFDRAAIPSDEEVS